MVFAYVSDDFQVDLRHEMTHAILHSYLPMVPLWLDEGLAEYFEVSESERYAGNPHLRSASRAVRWGQFSSLTNLEQQTEFSAMKADDYRDAWAWVHWLLHGPTDVQEEFLSYLADIQAHRVPGTLSTRLRSQSSLEASTVSNHLASVRREVSPR